MSYRLLRGLAQAGATILVLVSLGGAARAEAGQPVPWQMGFQDAVTPIAEQINGFHTFLLYIITAITLFVLGLLIYVMVKFNARANPEPTKTSHNTVIEFLWTVVPIAILLAIAIPSFRLLFAQYNFPKADLTIKAVASQWFWSYAYPDHNDMAFDSVMVEEADLKPGQPRLLAVDNDIVVPVNKNVHVLVTANDVIHSWAVPSFGVKIDAVPGRVMRTWFRATKTGTYYGQCSELCGQRHAFMPIAVRVVTEEAYAAWLEKAKQEFSSSAPAGGEERASDAKRLAKLGQ